MRRASIGKTALGSRFIVQGANLLAGSGKEMTMAESGRVVTAKLPEELVMRLDEIGERIGRSKSWMLRQALGEWLTEEQRRYELTLEALQAVDEGRTIPHDQVVRAVRERRRTRAPQVPGSTEAARAIGAALDRLRDRIAELPEGSGELDGVLTEIDAIAQTLRSGAKPG